MLGIVAVVMVLILMSAGVYAAPLFGSRSSSFSGSAREVSKELIIGNMLSLLLVLIIRILI